MLDKNKSTLYLVRGVSGAGKSTFAKAFADAIGAWHLETDMYFMKGGVYTFDRSKLHRAHSWCQTATVWGLKHSRDVVVSNTGTTEAEVKVYQDIAKEHNANFVSLIIENRNDTMSVHDVPDAVLRRQRNRFSVKL